MKCHCKSHTGPASKTPQGWFRGITTVKLSLEGTVMKTTPKWEKLNFKRGVELSETTGWFWDK